MSVSLFINTFWHKVIAFVLNLTNNTMFSSNLYVLLIIFFCPKSIECKTLKEAVNVSVEVEYDFITECRHARQLFISFDKSNHSRGEVDKVTLYNTMNNCEAQYCLNVTVEGRAKFIGADNRTGSGDGVIYSCNNDPHLQLNCTTLGPGCHHVNMALPLTENGGDRLIGNFTQCCCKGDRLCNSPRKTRCSDMVPITMNIGNRTRLFPYSSKVNFQCYTEDTYCANVEIIGNATWKKNKYHENAVLSGKIATCSDTEPWHVDCTVLGPGCHSMNRFPLWNEQYLEGKFNVCCCNTNDCNDVEETIQCANSMNLEVKFNTSDPSDDISQRMVSSCKASKCFNATVIDSAEYIEKISDTEERVGKVSKAVIQSCINERPAFFDCDRMFINDNQCRNVEAEIPTVAGRLKGNFTICCCDGTMKTNNCNDT